MKVVLALVAMAGVAHAQDPWPTFASSCKFTEQGGEAIYQSVCAGCHMPDGYGATGAATYPSLAGDAHLAAASYPIGVVLKGQRAMPPLGWALTDAQIAAVVGYVRTRFSNGFAQDVTEAEVAAER